MPIVNSRETTGKLSPLEEEEVADGGGELAMTVDKKTRKSTDGVHSTGGVSVFTTLGSLILTARPYNGSTRGSRWTGGEEEERGEEEGEDGQGATLQGEIFQTLNKESLFVMQEHMEKLWCERIPMCIEVKGQATPSPNESRSLLLEQWLIQVLPRRSHPHPIPLSFLTHAVQSYLHFSQIRSWIVSHRGSLPFDLTYRVCAPGEDDTSDQFSPHPPKVHTFPPSPLSPLTSLQVTIRHLPRLKTVPTTLTSSSASRDGGDSIISKFRDLSISKSAERLKDLSVIRKSSSMECPQNCQNSFSKSAECLKDLVLASGAYTVSRSRLLSKSAERVRDLSTRSKVVTPPYLTKEPPSPHAHSPRSPQTPSSYHSLTPSPHHHSSHLHRTSLSATTDAFPFSPPQPSPMSPKLLAGLGEPLQYHSLLDRNALNATSHDNGMNNGKAGFEISGCSSECSCQSLERGSDRDGNGGHSCSASFCFDSLCVREGGCEEGEGRRRRRRGDSSVNKVEKVVKRGAVRSPAASSPVPFMRRTTSETKNQHKRSSAINLKGVLKES
ncbi:Protein FAM214A [Geodia barretti]|uniref:Protein FAM214A n=1 Tax=Geodia barretti TaxID=519541 RepID=A0AA35RK05_GEOBA|nr:Protein FAM214A [Geodia barretti]